MLPRRVQGVIFSIGASLCTSSGLVVQKHAHNMGEWALPLLSRWRWWIGLVAICCGGVCDSIALSLAPMSVIAPLSGITILLNSLLASFFLGERIRIIEIFATMVIFTGATFTCVYGAHDVPPHTVDELFELFGQESFTIFLSVLASLVTVCLLGLRASGGTSMEDTLAPFLYATIAASLGGLELILLKAVMEVLHTALLGGKIEQLEDGGSYTLFAIFALVAMAQLYAINLALAQCDAVRVLPVYQSLFIVAAVIGGGAYFNEFKAFTEDQWLYFPLGVVIVLFGALILGITPNSEVTRDKDKEPMEGMPAGEPAVEGSYVQLEEAA